MRKDGNDSHVMYGYGDLLDKIGDAMQLVTTNVLQSAGALENSSLRYNSSL